VKHRIATNLAVEALSLASDWTRLSRDYSVMFYMRDGDLRAHWDPEPPSTKAMRRIASRYVPARDAFLQTVAERIGGRVLVIGNPMGGKE